MIKFATLVKDDVGEQFKQWCLERGQTPYAVISSFIHKAVGSTPPATLNRSVAVVANRKVQALQQNDGVQRCAKCGRRSGDCAHTSSD